MTQLFQNGQLNQVEKILKYNGQSNASTEFINNITQLQTKMHQIADSTEQTYDTNKWTHIHHFTAIYAYMAIGIMITMYYTIHKKRSTAEQKNATPANQQTELEQIVQQINNQQPN